MQAATPKQHKLLKAGDAILPWDVCAGAGAGAAVRLPGSGHRTAQQQRLGFPLVLVWGFIQI